jgi:GNAT superfamily N-acetyltransferase
MEAVREAVPADGTRVAELVEEFLAGVVSQRGGRLLVDPDREPGGPGGSPAWPGRPGDDPDRLVLVGTLDAVVTGVAVCHHEDRGTHRRHGVLDVCYVEPEARGLGLGQLLVEGALAWLEAHGCAGVDGVALPGDRPAKSFFEAAGFKARAITMYRELG